MKRSTSQMRRAILDDYVIFLGESDYDISNVVDLVTFHDAISNPQFGLWLDAMKDEISSMAQNEVWKLVELSQGYRPIGCKSVYKMNMK